MRWVCLVRVVLVALLALSLFGCASLSPRPTLWQRLDAESFRPVVDSWARHHPTMVHMQCFPFYCHH